MKGKNKEYRGRLNASGEAVVEVVGEDGVARPLHHIVWHSPTGFGWGYGGSGPADLALSILADTLCERPTTDDVRHGRAWCLQRHQDYKWAAIAPLAQDEPFVIRAEEVEAWLSESGVDVSRPTSLTILMPRHPSARAALASWLYASGEGILNTVDVEGDDDSSEGLREIDTSSLAPR